MKPAIKPKDLAAAFDIPLSPESKKFQEQQSKFEAMDLEIVPMLEQRLFTFDSFQHFDQDWKPRNEFEGWVESKLFIHCEVVLQEGPYNIQLKYSNGFLSGAFVKSDGYVHYYSQMEFGWSRQYSKPVEV